MALLRSFMNADVELTRQLDCTIRRTVRVTVFLTTPGAVLWFLWPIGIAWALLGALFGIWLSEALRTEFGFWLVWPLYYLATCIVFWLFAWAITRRRPLVLGGWR